MVSSFCLIHAQTQIGDDIDGEHARDQSGYIIALSSDGLRLAIGASGNDDAEHGAGHVRVYEWNKAHWVQVGDDIDGEQGGEDSGRGVSMSPDGNRVAVGAYMNHDGGFEAGQVRMYEWNGTTWRKMGENISARTFSQWMGLGESISMSTNRVAIGVPGAYVEGRGYVQIYEWNGMEWIQQGEDIEGEASGDGSGFSVSLSEDGFRVAIGASGNDGTGFHSGHTRIYEWSGSDWQQLGRDIDGEASGDLSGRSVSISKDGNRVAIGAMLNDGNGDRSGHVRVYEWSSREWIQLGEDIDGYAPGAWLGRSVALSADGNILTAGGCRNTVVDFNPGNVWIYEWNGTHWIQRGRKIEGEGPTDWFGHSVAISADGETVAAGAFRNDGNGPESGHVRVFDLSGVTSVVDEQPEQIVVQPNPTTGPVKMDLPYLGPFRIVDGHGEIVRQGDTSVDQPDLSGLPPGSYFLQISTRSGWSNTRVIKF